MYLLETDTSSNVNISSAAEVGSYTAAATKDICAQVFADQIAGNGEYNCYLTVQRAGAGSAYRLQPETTVTLPSGATAAVFSVGPVTVQSGDIVKAYLDGLAGDTTTPDIICEWWEDDTGWNYSTRTLTQTAASVASVLAGSTLTIQRGDSLSVALTSLGALTDYVSVDFTVKASKSDTDSQAVIRIRKNASGLNDGLLTLNGATGTAAQGSLTIGSIPLGNITIVLDEAATDDLYPASGLYYDVQMITASGVTTLTSGICNITADVTRAIA